MYEYGTVLGKVKLLYIHYFYNGRPIKEVKIYRDSPCTANKDMTYIIVYYPKKIPVYVHSKGNFLS